MPQNIKINEVIDLPNIFFYAQSLLVEKVIIILEEGATIELSDIHRSSIDRQIIFRSIDCYLAPAAQLTMLHDQGSNNNQSLFSRTTFYLAKKSMLNYALITTGSKVNKSWIDIMLQGPGV